MWVNKETIRAINKQSFLISNPCMINTEAKIILSFHFCWPATKIHSDAVDYLLIPVVQLLYNALGHCAGKLVRVIFKMLTDNVTFCLS